MGRPEGLASRFRFFREPQRGWSWRYEGGGRLSFLKEVTSFVLCAESPRRFFTPRAALGPPGSSVRLCSDPFFCRSGRVRPMVDDLPV